MDKWDQEQRMVAEAFQQGMAPFKQEPLVIYGIGKNTPAVLALTEGFTFAGLLDQDPANIGRTVYGKRVLSLEEAAAASKRIVIIARASLVPVIFRRIKAFTGDHGITVYDCGGRLLGNGGNSCGLPDLEYWDRSFEDLKTAVAQHDIISFDIFDTLIGRRVLQPQDVFALVEQELHEEGCQAPFAKLRIRAETLCGHMAALDDIYACLREAGIPGETCGDWRKRELAWERKVVFPREKMAELLLYAKKLGKRVFLTSDMYLPSEQLSELLKLCGITGYDALLVSCEEKAEKSDGSLFGRLLERAGEGTVLHIGDNAFADGEMPRCMGIDTWRIYSGYDLLAVSSIGALLTDFPKELGVRLALGMLCAKLFADPFALHGTRGMVVLPQAEQVGYCILAPWALSFMQWAAGQVRAHGVKEFLFPSRDGYLFYHIGEIMQRHGYFPETALRYFKASRRALSTASIRSEEDLKKAVLRKELYLTKGELLTILFRIVPHSLDTEQAEHAEDPEAFFRYARSYLPEIQEEARYERKNYRTYLESQGLFNDRKSAVFDFFAAGTVQYYLEQMLGKPLLGLYCARTSPSETAAYLDREQILSAFGNAGYYGSENALQTIYIALEALLIDGDGSLAYFDETGNPVFQSSGGVSYLQALETQRHICRFTDDYLSMFGPISISLEAADQFLKVISEGYCRIPRPAADAFIHDDPTVAGSGGPVSFVTEV